MLLGRTANGLYWMNRYIERTENMARLIDAGLRIALTRSQDASEEWKSVLLSAGAASSFAGKHSDYTAENVADFLLRDMSNPSSAVAAMETARNNARMVRTALTRETWEATNECWIELKQLLSKRAKPADMPEVIDAIKRSTGLIRGTFHGTMLRDDIYNFSRIGTFIERADNTARILDVKYYVLLPAIAKVGSSLDNKQWESILRSVSAHRSYSWVYDGDYSPANISDFLILNDRMPRSLAYSYDKIVSNLGYLAKLYGDNHAAHETASSTLMLLRSRTMDDIMDQGLHEFIEEFIVHNNRLGEEISEGYRFYR